MTPDATPPIARIGVLWRGNPHAAPPSGDRNRLHRIIEAIEAQHAAVEPVVYADDVAAEVRDRLLTLDGVLVWVDPITDGNDRSVLDPLLREVAAQGVWVSTHPDVIMNMGTKDVLYRTRDLPWGTDTRLYRTVDELRTQLPTLLAAGPRVLKQHRGNGGNGVWKVELARGSSSSTDATVQVLHALRGSTIEEMRLGDFIDRCLPYFSTGGMADQPFQPRLGDGMIRCYMVQDRVAGFGHQFVRALMPPPPPDASPEEAAVPPRLYYGPTKPEFQALKNLLESEWIAEMQRTLDIDTESLPVLWDADFLYGPKAASGDDTYLLGEINVSCVFPMPDEAAAPLAAAAVRLTRKAKAARRR